MPSCRGVGRPRSAGTKRGRWMPGPGLLLLGLLLCLGPARPAAGEPSELAICYFERPPFYVTGEDGAVGGLVGDRARRILTLAKLPHRFVNLPIRRGLELIRRGEQVCGLGWFRLPQRESFANFSRPIYHDRSLVLAVRRERKASLPPRPRLADLLAGGFRLVIQDGFTYGAWADERLAPHVSTVERQDVDELGLLRMVAAGRREGTLLGQEEAAYLLRHHPGLAARLAMLPLADAPPGHPRYFMCSKEVPPEVLERLDRAILKLGLP